MYVRTLIGVVLSAAVLGGCSSFVPAYQQRLVNTLPDKREVKFHEQATYPGKILCGTFTARSGDGFATLTRAYVIGPEFVITRPDETQSRVYCSREPQQALYESTGIGAADDEWALLIRVRDDMLGIEQAVEDYYRRQQVAPATLQALADELAAKGASISDPWGRQYRYERGLSGRVGPRYTLGTLGADGSPGGRGTDADISREHLQLLAHVIGLRAG